MTLVQQNTNFDKNHFKGFTTPLAICLGLNFLGLQLESFAITYVRPCMSPLLHRVLVGPALGVNFVMFVVFNAIGVIGLDATVAFAEQLVNEDVWVLSIILAIATVYGNLNYMLDTTTPVDADKKQQ